MKSIGEENLGVQPFEAGQWFDIWYENGPRRGSAEVKRVTEKAILLTVSDDKWTYSKEMDLWIPISIVSVHYAYFEDAYEEYKDRRRKYQKVVIPEWFVTKNKHWFRHVG